MKKQTVILFLIILFFAGMVLHAGNPGELGKTVLSIASRWDELTLAPLSEDCLSAVPEAGLRGKYAHLKHLIGIDILEKFAGCPVFVKGPHKGGLNLKSMTEYGHYNPAFLAYVQKELGAFRSSKSGIDGVKRIYDKYLKKLVRIYFLSFQYLQESGTKESVIRTYAGMLRTSADCANFDCSPSFYLQEAFRFFAESREQEGYDIYEAFTAPGFWVRRSLDGTDKQFMELITMVLETWDPGFYSDWMKKRK